MKLFRRGRVLRAQFGCNPNSSSLGVDVTFLLFGAALASGIAAVLGALLRRSAPSAAPGAALSLEEAKRILDELAAMGVFHVALGGGEALELDYLFAVAEHAHRVGIVPNLTTSGLGMTQ